MFYNSSSNNVYKILCVPSCCQVPTNPENSLKLKKPLKNIHKSVICEDSAVFTSDKLSLQKWCFYLTANKTQSLSIKYLTPYLTDLLCVIDPTCRFCIGTNTIKQTRYRPLCDRSTLRTLIMLLSNSVFLQSVTAIPGLMLPTLNWFWWHTVWYTDYKSAKREQWHQIDTQYQYTSLTCFSCKTQSSYNIKNCEWDVNCICISIIHLQDFLHQWHNRLGPSGLHGNVWTPTWSQREKQWILCLAVVFAAVVCRCSAGVYPLRSCRVVTASEHPSLPGRSNMLPQSGCLSKRTSASVRDTGRKHLHATHTNIIKGNAHTLKVL